MAYYGGMHGMWGRNDYGSDGQYRLWLPEGRWDVWLWHDDYESFNAEVTVTPEEPTMVRAVLRQPQYELQPVALQITILP